MGTYSVFLSKTRWLAIMVIIYVSASAILWYEGWPRASIGYLLFVVSAGVLAVVGLKNNPLAIIGFFGSALFGEVSSSMRQSYK